MGTEEECSRERQQFVKKNLVTVESMFLKLFLFEGNSTLLALCQLELIFWSVKILINLWSKIIQLNFILFIFYFFLRYD